MGRSKVFNVRKCTKELFRDIQGRSWAGGNHSQLRRARQLAAEGYVPGGTRRNLAWISDRLDPAGHDELTQLLFADAQTSGGLIFGVDEGHGGAVAVTLAEAGHTAAPVKVQPRR